MPDAGEQPAKPRSESNGALLQGKPVRTWRPMILWSGGIVLALGLVWFVAAVVIPVWQVDGLVRKFRTPEGVVLDGMLEDARQSAKRVRLYIRVMRPIKSRWEGACILLAACNDSSTPAAIDGLADPNLGIRLMSIDSLSKPRPDGKEANDAAAMAIEGATKDANERVRTAAAEALKKIRGEEPPK